MTTAETCSLHSFHSHSPANLTVEDHHVIPQAWQHFWVSTGYADGSVKAPFGGTGGLWDARTVPICPTGHRNVHMMIVAMMKAAARLKSEDLAKLVGEAGYRASTQRATALLALERFTAAGGKLLDLTAAGEWGEA